MIFHREDALPRMRAYLARAGLASLVSEASASSPELIAEAREVYALASEASDPTARALDAAERDFPSDVIPDELAGCRAFTLLFFSLGVKFDEVSSRLFDEGRTSRGVLFDSWGSEAVEALACAVDRRLREAHGEGTMRFAPGYAGYDIRHNREWFDAIAASCAPGELSWCDVDCQTGIITPRKSIICAIGWRNV